MGKFDEQVEEIFGKSSRTYDQFIEKLDKLQVFALKEQGMRGFLQVELMKETADIARDLTLKEK